MRRKEREITDFFKKVEILKNAGVLRIGLTDEEGEVYIVPLSFGLKISDSAIYIYFHSAKSGKKAELLKKARTLSFEADTLLKTVTADVACEFTAHYESVMGKANVALLEESEEKREALDSLMEHNGCDFKPVYNESALLHTDVYRLTVTELTAKRSV